MLDYRGVGLERFHCTKIPLYVSVCTLVYHSYRHEFSDMIFNQTEFALNHMSLILM